MRWQAETTVEKMANVHYTRPTVKRVAYVHLKMVRFYYNIQTTKSDIQQNDDLEQNTSSVHAVGVAHAESHGERTKRCVSVSTGKISND